jgi:predicted kinase
MQDRTATAFLIHGYLGAGKTTLARRLEVEQAAVRFTHDEWMRSLYAPRDAGPYWPTGDDLPETRFAECAQRVSAVMEMVWTRCVVLKMNVVLDFGFWRRSERDRIRDLVASLDGKSALYRLSCRDDVAWSRIERRNERLGDDLYIEPNTFRVLKARFEPLDPDEDRVEVEG